ncbi:hypothetical protein LPJ70_001111 [Coemansia sp. RSA 2708]|nr:hypothetical protein LPJ70_001111 [Coemansia sp. RSA 2708]
MILTGAAIIWIHKKRKMRQAIRDVDYSDYPDFDFSPSAPQVVQSRPIETSYTPPAPAQPPQPAQQQPYSYSTGPVANQQLYAGAPEPQWPPPQHPNGLRVVNTDRPQPPMFMRNLDNP